MKQNVTSKEKLPYSRPASLLLKEIADAESYVVSSFCWLAFSWVSEEIVL